MLYHVVQEYQKTGDIARPAMAMLSDSWLEYAPGRHPFPHVLDKD